MIGMVDQIDQTDWMDDVHRRSACLDILEVARHGGHARASPNRTCLFCRYLWENSYLAGRS